MAAGVSRPGAGLRRDGRGACRDGRSSACRPCTGRPEPGGTCKWRWRDAPVGRSPLVALGRGLRLHGPGRGLRLGMAAGMPPWPAAGAAGSGPLAAGGSPGEGHLPRLRPRVRLRGRRPLRPGGRGRDNKRGSRTPASAAGCSWPALEGPIVAARRATGRGGDNRSQSRTRRTILPRTPPCSRRRCASGTCSRGSSESMAGRNRPRSINVRRASSLYRARSRNSPWIVWFF